MPCHHVKQNERPLDAGGHACTQIESEANGRPNEKPERHQSAVYF